MICEYENLVCALYNSDKEVLVSDELFMKVFPMLYGVATTHNDMTRIYNLTVELISSKKLIENLNLKNRDLCEKSEVIQAYVRGFILLPTSLRSRYFRAIVLWSTKIDIEQVLKRPVGDGRPHRKSFL